ncbi:MAG: hypothetical protein LBN21_13490, partial [Treponema sp.]|nr:hypothetical protein [Treponema sp.]
MENNSIQLTNTEEIVFDPNSGITEDEQREILSEINNITEKNRQSLSAQGGAPDTAGENSKKQIIHAKKRGTAFPLIINI